jgi:AcrR family transcriptional regulator
MPVSRKNRSYESPLRAEQMDRTREKLIAAGVDIVAEAGGEELTVRLVAARAGVSVPTAYRHFPDRDALVSAMALWVNEKIGGVDVPRSFEDATAWIRQIYARFEINDRLMRAQLNTPAGRQLRAKNQKARHHMILGMTEASFPSATPVMQHRLAALVQLLVNVPAWVSLHDNWGMGGVEAGAVTGWAMETLIAEVRRNPSALDFALPAPAQAPPPAPAALQPHQRPARRKKSR